MKRLELLDYGRLFAAACVMVFHYFFNGIHNGKISSLTHMPGVVDVAKYGYLGVEFFFMISGYVIFFSAKEKSASEFAVSRAVRLYPAFWVAVVFTSAFSWRWGGEAMKVSLSQFAANLTMIPGMLGQEFVDGVYWTLQLELKYYALVLVVLMLGQRARLGSILLAWPFAILVATLAGRPDLTLLGRHYCYFAAGAVFALAREKTSPTTWVALAVCVLLCLDYSCGQAADNRVSRSALVIGAIVLAQYGFFLLLNCRAGSAARLPGSKLAGAITYPWYLIHAHIGYMLLSRFASEESKFAAYTLTVVFVLVAAYLIHVLVERRYSRAWKALFSATVGAIVSRAEGWVAKLRMLAAPASRGAG